MTSENVLNLSGAADSPAIARHYVSRLASQFGELSTEVLDDVLVLVSELVTNAVRHGRPPIRFELDHSDSGFRLSVHDSGAALPVVHTPADAASSGRGLLIVQSLARQWGVSVDPQSGGKTVWCEIHD